MGREERGVNVDGMGGKGTQSYTDAQTQQKQNNNQQSCGEGLKMACRGKGVPKPSIGKGTECRAGTGRKSMHDTQTKL